MRSPICDKINFFCKNVALPIRCDYKICSSVVCAMTYERSSKNLRVIWCYEMGYFVIMTSKKIYISNSTVMLDASMRLANLKTCNLKRGEWLS